MAKKGKWSIGEWNNAWGDSLDYAIKWQPALEKHICDKDCIEYGCWWEGEAESNEKLALSFLFEECTSSCAVDELGTIRIGDAPKPPDEIYDQLLHSALKNQSRLVMTYLIDGPRSNNSHPATPDFVRALKRYGFKVVSRWKKEHGGNNLIALCYTPPKLKKKVKRG